MPSSIRVVDGLAGVSAPAEHVAIGFTGWRCQASPATQDGSPTSRRRSFYLFLMPDAFPSMPLTDAQAAVKAGEAVLTYERWCRTTYTPESVCRTREVRGLSKSIRCLALSSANAVEPKLCVINCGHDLSMRVFAQTLAVLEH